MCCQHGVDRGEGVKNVVAVILQVLSYLHFQELPAQAWISCAACKVDSQHCASSCCNESKAYAKLYLQMVLEKKQQKADTVRELRGQIAVSGVDSLHEMPFVTSLFVMSSSEQWRGVLSADLACLKCRTSWTNSFPLSRFNCGQLKRIRADEIILKTVCSSKLFPHDRTRWIPCIDRAWCCVDGFSSFYVGSCGILTGYRDVWVFRRSW